MITLLRTENHMEQQRMVLKGIVENAFCKTEGGDPYAFKIKSNGKSYFCHLGDLERNEEKLYKNLSEPTEFLKNGDEVEFEVFTPQDPLAIHVHKSTN
jgi:hypothetical protein